MLKRVSDPLLIRQKQRKGLEPCKLTIELEHFQLNGQCYHRVNGLWESPDVRGERLDYDAPLGPQLWCDPDHGHLRTIRLGLVFFLRPSERRVGRGGTDRAEPALKADITLLFRTLLAFLGVDGGIGRHQ